MNKKLRKSLVSACKWLTDVAQVKDNQPVGKRGRAMNFNLWNGAVKGEYCAATKEWNTFGPAWHTGQAVKALVMAEAVLNCPDLLDAAKYGAGFITANQAREGEDAGVIFTFEDFPDLVCTAGVLETVDGLFMLAEAVGKTEYEDAANAAVRWVVNKTYCPAERLFRDAYRYSEHRFIDGKLSRRPLLDDAVFLKSWRSTGEEIFKKVTVEIAEMLLENENPPGNWIKYGPCNSQTGNIHPRHAYWWGMPMLEVYKATGDERFLQCFFRSVNWYKQALRRDGGFIRNTYTDFNTDSFGHATSGTACAVIAFLKYYEYTGDKAIVEYIEKGLNYCMKMQFADPEDPNLKGAVLEKIMPPDGTDRSPYHIRDLGTIFFIQAAALYLQIFEKGKLAKVEAKSETVMKLEKRIKTGEGGKMINLIVKLRAYHPTYLVCFFGNQSIASENHNKSGFTYVYEILKKEPNTIVELVKEFDDICTRCKKSEKDEKGSVWSTDMSCTSSRNEEVVRKLHASSIKVLETLGLNYGSRISWKDLVKLLSERIPRLNDPMIGGRENQGNYEAGFKVLEIKMGTQKTS